MGIEDAQAHVLLFKDLRSRPRPRVPALMPIPPYDLPLRPQTQGDQPRLLTKHRARERGEFKAEVERSMLEKKQDRAAKTTRVDVIADDWNFVSLLHKTAGQTSDAGLRTSHTVRASHAHSGAYGAKCSLKKKEAVCRGCMEVHLWGWVQEDLWHRQQRAAKPKIPGIPELGMSKLQCDEATADSHVDIGELDVDIGELDMYRDD